VYEKSKISLFPLENLNQYLQTNRVYQNIVIIQRSIQQILDFIPPNSEEHKEKYRLVKTIIFFVCLAALFFKLSISLLPIISISLAIIISLPIIATIVHNHKKKLLDRTKFGLVKKDDKPVLIKNISLEKNSCLVETIYPQLDRENNYQLQWIEKKYSLDLIATPKENRANFKIWQEIGELLQESWRIEARIVEHKIQIQKCTERKKMVEAAVLFAKFIEKFEQLISKFDSEIIIGRRLCEEIHQLIRDYLIGMEIAEDSSIDIINAIETSKQKNQALGSNFEDKYSSLRLELDSYLDTIDDYSELMESFERSPIS
jgi:hypothetical protein